MNLAASPEPVSWGTLQCLSVIAHPHRQLQHPRTASAHKAAVLDYVSEMYLSAERTPDNSIWQTLHSSIYDLKNLTLRLHVQENYEKSFEYQF